MGDDDEELPPCIGERLRDITLDVLRNGICLLPQQKTDAEQSLREPQ